MSAISERELLILHRLGAIRELLDATLRLLDDEPDASSEHTSAPCDHAMEYRRPAGVMGDPEQFFCLRCTQLIAATPAAAEIS